MHKFDRYINITIEVLCLATLFFLPLALASDTGFVSQDMYSRYEVPKTVFFRVMTSIILTLIFVQLIKRSISQYLSGKLYSSTTVLFSKCRSYLFNFKIQNLITLALFLYILISIVATLLSAHTRTSMWGQQAGNDPFSLHSVMFYGLFYFIILSQFKNRAQIEHLFWIIALSGAFISGYGFFEYLGYDWLKVNESSYRETASTLGNSLIAGSVLLLTIGFTLSQSLGFLTNKLNLSKIHYWVKFIGLSSVLSIQFLGIILTGSRGPLYSCLILIVLITGAGIWFSTKSTIRNISIFIITSGLLTLIIFGSTSVLKDSLLVPQNDFLNNPTATMVPTDTPVPQQDLSINSESGNSLNSSLNSRLYIWKTTLLFAQQRTELPNSEFSTYFTRLLFGYGPEMFQPAFLLKAPPFGKLQIPASPDQAHNMYLHQLAEQGFTGLIACMVLFGAPIFILVTLIKPIISRRHTPELILFTCLTIVLLCRIIEQQVGISKTTDTVFTWTLLAFLSWFIIKIRPAPQFPSMRGNVLQRPELIMRIAVLVSITLILGSITLTKSINYYRAGTISAESKIAYNEGNFQEGYLGFEKAIKLAPDLPVNYHYQYYALRLMPDYINSKYTLIQSECSTFIDFDHLKECFFYQAHVYAQNGHLQQPFDWYPALVYSQSAFDLKFDQVAYSAYRTAISLSPNSYDLYNGLARFYMKADTPLESIPLLETSLSLTGDSHNSYTAFYLLGNIYEQQERLVEAYDMYMKGLVSAQKKGIDDDGWDGITDKIEKTMLSMALSINRITEELGIPNPVSIETTAP